MKRLILPVAVAAAFGLALNAAPSARADEKVLFDFENAGELSSWSNLELPNPNGTTPSTPGAVVEKEPSAKLELSTEHASQGRQSLKITFDGGRWPAITTMRIPGDWMPYHTFKADVTVTRACVVCFRVMQEGSSRSDGYDGAVSRWVKTQFMQPGRNTVAAELHPNHWSAIGKTYGKDKPLGSVVRLEIFMYQPLREESIYVDDVRLSSEKLPVSKPVKPQFKVLGTDLVVDDVKDLGKRLADRWVKPAAQTVAEAEADFQAQYENLRRRRPRAVSAVFREGQEGYDPTAPDKVYSGWQDAYFNSHGPDGLNVERAINDGQRDSREFFMRHRSPLLQVDLSSIPSGSDILAARLLVVRSRTPEAERSPNRPNMWVAEACNRPWKEYEVNAYQYARDKYWQEIGGQFYEADPDFLPLYLAHGPSRDGCSTWDFTHAVRYWTDSPQENHGFMLHGDGHDWFIAWYREAAEIKNRPALLIIYEPK